MLRSTSTAAPAHAAPCLCSACVPPEVHLSVDLALTRVALDAVTRERDEVMTALQAVERELTALRWVARARERYIVRLLQELRALRRRLPRHEQRSLTPQEAFIAAQDIAQVIGQVVELTPREDGFRRYLVGRCPFCDDGRGSPSFVVRPWYAQFICYACEAHGTVLDFLRFWRARAA